jgi:LemA protein
VKYFLGGLLFILLLYALLTYNKLITLQQRINNGWAQVDVQLKLRYDLVFNLVNTVKAYAAHEKQTLESVTALRQKAMTVQSLPEQAQLEKKLTGAIQGLFIVAENYPELQADENFRQLQEQLKEIEDKIAFARLFFNDTVLKYNLKVQMFPSNIMAKIFRFKTKAYFNLDDNLQAREAVEVNFE